MGGLCWFFFAGVEEKWEGSLGDFGLRCGQLLVDGGSSRFRTWI